MSISVEHTEEAAIAALNRDEEIRFLKNVPLFQRLSDQDLNIVAGLIEHVSAEADEVLVREGEAAKAFMIVLDGTARVERNGGEIRKLTKGDHFGEIALIEEGPRTATVVAETPLKLMEISRGRFDYLLNNYPEMVRKLLAALCQYVYRAEAELDALKGNA